MSVSSLRKISQRPSQGAVPYFRERLADGRDEGSRGKALKNDAAIRARKRTTVSGAPGLSQNDTASNCAFLCFIKRT